MKRCIVRTWAWLSRASRSSFPSWLRSHWSCCTSALRFVTLCLSVSSWPLVFIWDIFSSSSACLITRCCAWAACKYGAFVTSWYFSLVSHYSPVPAFAFLRPPEHALCPWLWLLSPSLTLFCALPCALFLVLWSSARLVSSNAQDRWKPCPA